MNNQTDTLVKSGKIGFPIAMAAALVWLLFRSWEGLCLSDSGTQYLMTGQTSNPLVFTCEAYDYSRFFPEFEEKTDSFRIFR